MTSNFMKRTAQNFLMVKAVRELKEEIEKAGLDNLKILADANISIIATYLQGCSPEERGRYKRDGTTLLQMGITPDMILSELTRQNPDLAPIMEGREDYKKAEIQNLEAFLKGGSEIK